MNTHYIEEFNLHYADKSKHTLVNYNKAVKDYYVFMIEVRGCQTEDEIIDKTNWSNCQIYRNKLIAKGYHPKTVNNHLSGLRTFFGFLVKLQRISVNPFQDIEQVSTKSVKEYDRPYLQGSDFDKLITTIQTKVQGKKQDAFELTSTRDSLAVGTLLTSGLRISELLNIKLDDIDTETGLLTVLGKGNKVREVKIGHENLIRLQEYLYVRKTYASDTEFLFVNRYGNKITPQSMHKNLKGYLQRAGLNTDVSLHGLRASCASNHIANGVAPIRVKTLLGHESLDTTMKHYVKVKENFDFID